MVTSHCDSYRTLGNDANDATVYRELNSFGLALAVFLGTWHVLWALLVWVGAAQWLLDFVFQLHMITPAYHVTTFSLFTATGLVLITVAVAYVAGWFIGFVWNQLVALPAGPIVTRVTAAANRS
jgi:hypothetical protein